MISTGNTQKHLEMDYKGQTTNPTCIEIYLNSQAEMQPSPQQPTDDKRRNQKNKFINKLKQLEAKTQVKTLHKSLTSQSGQWPARTDRKERNKMAARQSRNRKKLYVKLMETKIQNLEMEMIETVEEIEQLRLEIFNAQMHQGVQDKEAKHKQLHIIKKMEGLLVNQNFDQRNNQINICLDSIVYRIGAVGSQRKVALKKLYSDLLNYSQPALYRYMFWSAVKKRHIFGQTSAQSDEKWWKEIEQVATEILQTPDLKEKLDGVGKQISSHCYDFYKSAANLQRFRLQIEKKGQHLDNCFSEIREILLPEQAAQLILFAERYQFRRELRLFEQENGRTPKKKVKNEDNSV